MSEKREVTNYFSDNDSPLERKLARFLTILHYIGIVACFVMVFITVRHAIGRYAFNAPIIGNIEITCFSMVVLVFMVIAFTQMRHGHIEIGVIVDRFPLKVREIVAIIVDVLIIMFLVWATWRTGMFAVKQTLRDYSDILMLPNWPFLYLITFCWAVIIIPFAVQLWHSIRKVRGVEK
jgi:TRAP-type C4-dicarboxylate transport system permease small subunit